MTMHPDPHAPHPIKRSRMVLAAKPRAQKPSALRLVLGASLEGAVFFVSLAVLLLAVLLIAGTDAQVHAWAHWARNLVGG